MSNYKCPMNRATTNCRSLITYRFRISMRCTGIRRGEVASPDGLGNPTPTKDYAAVQRAYTISKSECYNQSEALNELHYYEPPMIVNYRFRISMRCAGIRRGGLPRPMGWGTQPLRRIMRPCSALVRFQNLNVTINRRRSMNRATTNCRSLITYRFRISMRCTGIRRGEVASPDGLGNPTPTKDYAAVQRAYTISKSECYNQSEALNELHYYEPPMIVNYRFRISMRCAGIRRGGLPRPMGWGTQPLRRIMRPCSALVRFQNLNVTINRRRSMN